MASFVSFRPQQEQPVPVDEELIKILRVIDSSFVVLDAREFIVCLVGGGNTNSFLWLNFYLFFSDSTKSFKNIAKNKRYVQQCMHKHPIVKRLLKT
jgi:hypothetical protein